MIHLFDIVPWLIAAGERPGKELDEVEVHTHITRPADALAQVTVADHEELFPGFAARNPYSHAELQQLTGAFGEVDAFSSMAYRSGGRTMTLGSINLAHHTFSQRGNLEPVLAGLYKGNGRIGQETHIIQQGPFQALHFHCLQTLHDDTPGVDPAAVGGADHVAVHVFRNNHLHPQWERHTPLGFADLTSGSGLDATLPTQRSSRHVHRNAPRYDVAYLLAHVLLHHLRWPTHAPALTAALLDAYANATREPTRHWADDPLMATVAAGVILYRLAAHITPYPPTASPVVREQYHGQVIRLLNTGRFTVPDLLDITEQASR
ncbi:MAG: hypothetical protein ACT4NY_24565 [Pseudonocardiales bacterium]